MGRDIAIPCRRHCLYANTVDGVSGTAKSRALSAEAGMRRAAKFLIQIVALQPAANRPAGQGGRRRAGRCGRPQYLAMQGIRRLRHAAAQPVPCNADKRNYRAYTSPVRFTAPLTPVATIGKWIEVPRRIDAQ